MNSVKQSLTKFILIIDLAITLMIQISCNVTVLTDGQWLIKTTIGNLTLLYESVIDGANPTGIRVEGVTRGGVVSLHKGSCDNKADNIIKNSGIILPASANTYTESDLYIKYIYSNSWDCQKLDTKYIYLEKPVLALDEESSKADPARPTLTATNLYPDKIVRLQLYREENCSGTPISQIATTNTGTTSIKTSISLIPKNHELWVKQS